MGLADVLTIMLGGGAVTTITAIIKGIQQLRAAGNARMEDAIYRIKQENELLRERKEEAWKNVSQVEIWMVCMRATMLVLEVETMLNAISCQHKERDYVRLSTGVDVSFICRSCTEVVPNIDWLICADI